MNKEPAIRIAWPQGVNRLLDEARTDVAELHSVGRISRAADLVKSTGLDFEPTYFPMYFTGDFASRLVVVHLNPKLNTRLGGPRFADFDAYIDAHARFGFHHWDQDPAYRSAFDHKQVRFLRPFGAIDFLSATDARSKRRNASMAIDHKLQLELIPYPSSNFPKAAFSRDSLRPHFERVLGVIAAYPRSHVLFCGAIFDDLQARSGLLLARREHRFHLATKAGTSKAQYRFSNVTIEHDGRPIPAGIAGSFATQGLPMPAYGQRCYELYDASA